MKCTDQLRAGLPAGAIRTRDASASGVSRKRLAAMARAGEIERVGRGLYVPADAEITEHHTVVEGSRHTRAQCRCLPSLGASLS